MADFGRLSGVADGGKLVDVEDVCAVYMHGMTIQQVLHTQADEDPMMRTGGTHLCSGSSASNVTFRSYIEMC